MNFLSICIPTYEMHGVGKDFLEFSFLKLKNQTFKDFEVIISDHSKDNEIEKLCEFWKDKLNIKYFRNMENIGSSSANINNAIKKASGEWIKILFQDDFLFNENSLEKIIKFISNEDSMNWLVCGCEHSFDGVNMSRAFFPTWNNSIHLGNNTISSPSVVCFKNINNKIFFDKNLIWLMDVDFYKKMYEKYGEPKILNEIIIVNRLWDNCLSNRIPQQIKDSELLTMMNRYVN